MMAQIARAYSGLLDNVYWDILLLLHCTKIKYIGQTGKQEEFTRQIRTMDCGVQLLYQILFLQWTFVPMNPRGRCLDLDLVSLISTLVTCYLSIIMLRAVYQ